jgi:flagellar basal-body rod modification protein FlgD
MNPVSPSSNLNPSAGTTAGANSGAAANSPLQNLGESAFLQLLAAELQYQNPLQPMDNTQFVAELAQFSILAGVTGEQNTLNQILSQLQSGSAFNPLLAASQLLGKTVTTASGQGTVTAATVNNQGQVELTVSGLGSVPLNQVTEVANG